MHIMLQEIDLAASALQKDFESDWYSQHHPQRTWDLATAVAPRWAAQVVDCIHRQGWLATALRLEKRTR